MVSPVFDVKRTPVHTGRFSYQPHLNRREDSPLERTSIYIPHPHPLEQKSFTHLSIWAYLAIAFILLAVTTAFAYLVYTCCHSRKSRQRRNGAPWQRVPAMGGDGRAARMSDKVSDVGEKAKFGGVHAGRAVLDLKGFGFGHDRKQSESETKMIRLSRPSTSKAASSLSTTNAGSFDLEYNYLGSPPLAHDKEGSATCIPFHLPLPPPSPTTGYKQRMQRQMYRGQCSPVSPSPSTRSILSSPPPITDRLSAPCRKTDNKLPGGLDFDSNNIQYASPLNPFMTPPSTGFLWNGPKLSPIHGSIIACSPNINGGLSKSGRPSPGVLL